MSEDGREEAMQFLFSSYAQAPMLQELAAGRPPVRGHGPLGSPVMVIGEAPGAEEEKTGRPFVGPSGRLLRKLFDGAGIPWEMCYVTNTVCWRPPGNRTPYPFQVQVSAERVRQEIEIVDPLIIVAAGAVAWRGVTGGGIGRFDENRLVLHDLGGRKLLPVPHPSFILRLPDDERPEWEQHTTAALAAMVSVSA